MKDNRARRIAKPGIRRIPHFGSINVGEKPIEPLKAENLKDFACGSCPKVFRIAACHRARGCNFCSICQRQYTIGDGGKLYLAKPPWAY